MPLNIIWFIGVVSAYALAPTVATINYHQERGNIPQGNIDHSYIMVAVNDCGLIGKTGTIYLDETPLPKKAMVFDCLGGNGQYNWMSDSNTQTPWKVAAEFGYYDWLDYSELVGSGQVVRIEFER